MQQRFDRQQPQRIPLVGDGERVADATCRSLMCAAERQPDRRGKREGRRIAFRDRVAVERGQRQRMMRDPVERARECDSRLVAAALPEVQRANRVPRVRAAFAYM
jgi:hypothetical protein